MALLTRMKANVPSQAPNDVMAEYYEQRASDGGLIIREVCLDLAINTTIHRLRR
jgi:2,4-dienoyl-CoA reductase-like NADH-dependent reductase (Old Yellow Enzyme family)